MTPFLTQFPKHAFVDAFQTNQIEHHFQPLMDIESGHLVGFETLARWHHPQQGLLSSGTFIVSLVNHGFAAELTLIAVRKIAEFYHQAHAQGSHCVPVSVNITAAEFEAPQFAQHIASFIETLNLPPHMIHVELLEWSPANDNAVLAAAVKALSALGITVKADDFGDAYASFNRMMDMPFSGIKLDGEYVRSLDTKPAAKIIIQTLAGFADKMNMSLVVEGVETQAQLNALSSMGVHHAQGYLFGRPMAFEQAIKLLAPKRGFAQ